MSNEDDPKDWEEPKEEVPSENLKRKWIEREYFGKETVRCPRCEKFVPAENLTCLFCGETLSYDTGALGKILKWIKGLF